MPDKYIAADKRAAIDMPTLPLAMAYVPMQHWGAVYTAEKGLKEGTMFPELVLPFKGRTVAK